MNKIRLGVNVDHVATVRQARGTVYPDPVQAAILAEQAGADGITAHLREDRRHIQERDVRLMQEKLRIPLNLEMAITGAMLDFACHLKPPHVCLVPEKRQELTTEGGLDVAQHLAETKQACARLAENNSRVSLFIDPDEKQIQAAITAGAPVVELHTGTYADAATENDRQYELRRLSHACQLAHAAGLEVHAGHGLTTENVTAIAALPNIAELNIGHALVARALFIGLPEAIKEMQAAIGRGRF